MNRTMIALIAVSLGALLPVPAAEASSTVCAQETADKAVEDVSAALSRLLTNNVYRTPDEDVCVELCGQTMSTAAVATCGIPPVSTCAKGSYGLLVGDAGGCLEPQPVDPDPVLCKDGCVPNCAVPALTSVITALAYQANVCDALPTDDGNEPPPGEECKETDNDRGFGGTHVSCDYDCMAGDQLIIYGESDDKTWGKAEADGGTECGGAKADCIAFEADKTRCAGASGKPATFRDRATCKGESHEAIDDEYTIACYAVGVSTPCKIVHVPKVCDADLKTAHMACASGLDVSSEQSEVIAGLLAIVPIDVAHSFVVFDVNGSSALALGSTVNETGAARCWSDAFVLA
ncbi:MAG TPA: hypothetical protein VM327_05745 [Candidatus Thermoplasmatota archaeon]|nr:hypothetical protein [Candidatus Thermoplasmatota archaeon]